MTDENRVMTNAEAYHYPDCWDTTAYPTILHVLDEVEGFDVEHCAVCGKPFGRNALEVSRAGVDREYELMALLQTLDEFAPEDLDHDTDEEYQKLDKDSVQWFEHWRKHLPEMAGEEHSGDCTKESWACLRCHHDSLFERVQRAKR